MEPSDLELWQAAAAGNHQAFHALVDRHAPALFRVALSLSGRRCDAEDICQETFAAAFRGLGKFGGRSSLKTWLIRILIRRAAKLWHAQRHARRTISLDASADSDTRHNISRDQALAKQLSVPSRTGTVDQRLDVMEVIRSLPPEFGEVLILREVEGLSYQEIAQALKIPCGTVESRLYRARAQLRQKLSGY